MFVMFVTTEYLVYYRWLTNRYDCPVNVYLLYETYTTAGGCSVKKFYLYLWWVLPRNLRWKYARQNQFWNYGILKNSGSE